MTPDQYTVLRTLIENDGITQRELAQLISSDPNTVASLVSRMEQGGLIERETHEKDRRANRLGASRKGKTRFRQARETAIALQGEILAVLPDAKREDFLTQLAKVADACRDAAENSTDDSKVGRMRHSDS